MEIFLDLKKIPGKGTLGEPPRVHHRKQGGNHLLAALAPSKTRLCGKGEMGSLESRSTVPPTGWTAVYCSTARTKAVVCPTLTKKRLIPQD